jgi:hypothetical protein
MESYTFVFKNEAFENLMKGKGGSPEDAELFARIFALNREGHHVRIVEKDTGVIIHEFLPKSRSSEC